MYSPRRFLASSMRRADVRRGRDDREVHPGLLDRLDLADRRQLGRVVDATVVPPRRFTRYSTDGAEAMRSRLNSRSRRSWTICHVKQPEEPAPEPEPKRPSYPVEAERGVVEVQLLERVAQERVVLARQRVEPANTRLLAAW